MTKNKVKLRLQGHEKFALREGWINKGLMLIPKDSSIFSKQDAPDVFGIGNNMVKSLRYWMRAFGLLIEGGSAGVSLSPIGKLIAKYDPYIENPYTLWLMHSYIAKNKEEATAWYMYFNRCDANDLEKSQIYSILLREITQYASGQKFSEKSLSNDIDVLLNMYSKNKIKSDPEEKNISPFSQLALIKNVDGKYTMKHRDGRIFSEFVVLYELEQMLEGRDGLSIEEIVNGENGLAKIYNLTSVMANEYFDRLDAIGYIRVVRTAGLDMIYPVKMSGALNAAEEYYRNC